LNSKKSALPYPDKQSSSRPYVVLTPEGAGDYLGLDPRTVTRWARVGYLPAHPMGEGDRKFWRFYLHELDAWLAAQTNQGEAA
jgi:excisionase family DNA binding protein